MKLQMYELIVRESGESRQFVYVTHPQSYSVSRMQNDAFDSFNATETTVLKIET